MTSPHGDGHGKPTPDGEFPVDILTHTPLALMTTAPNIEMIASSLRHCSLNGGTGAGGDSGRRRGGTTRRRGAEGGDDSEGVTVELNSEVALPYHWEQCLDILTGQVYYINWEDGTRTTVDPRTTSAFSSPTPRSTSSASRRTRRASTPSSGYTSVSSVGADVTGTLHGAGNDSGYDNDDEEDDDGEEEDEEDEEEGDEDEDVAESSSSSSSTGSSRGSAVSSTLSSFSPTDESASGDNNGGRLGGAGHVLVAAGCRACFMYFMVPKRADVCPKCGSSGLLHLSRNGYA